MKKEKHFWNKHFIVLRPVSSLLVPENIVLAQAESTVYRNPGIGRSKRHKGRMVFQYTLSGRGVFERDGKRYDLTAGKGFFCDVLDEQMVYYYPADATEPWRFLYFTIHDRQLAVFRPVRAGAITRTPVKFPHPGNVSFRYRVGSGAIRLPVRHAL